MATRYADTRQASAFGREDCRCDRGASSHHRYGTLMTAVFAVASSFCMNARGFEMCSITSEQSTCA